MEASSLLRELQPGQRAYMEIAPDQRSKIAVIVRHRQARVISEAPLDGGRILLGVEKKAV